MIHQPLVHRYFPVISLLLMMLAAAINLALLNPVSAQQTSFEEGTALLDRGEYSRAIEVFDAIEADGYRSGALFLNQGVAYSGLNQTGTAKYYFLKARTFPETEQLANASIQFLDERFTHRSAVLPQLPWERLRNSIAGFFGANGLFWLSLFLLYLAAAGWIGAWFLQKGWMNYLSATAIALMILSLLMAISIHMNRVRYDVGVMVMREAAVHAQPSDSSAQVSTAYEGYLMTIDWARSYHSKSDPASNPKSNPESDLEFVPGSDPESNLEFVPESDPESDPEFVRETNTESDPKSNPEAHWVHIRLQNGQSGWIPAVNLLWFDPLDLR